MNHHETGKMANRIRFRHIDDHGLLCIGCCFGQSVQISSLSFELKLSAGPHFPAQNEKPFPFLGDPYFPWSKLADHFRYNCSELLGIVSKKGFCLCLSMVVMEKPKGVQLAST